MGKLSAVLACILLGLAACEDSGKFRDRNVETQTERESRKTQVFGTDKDGLCRTLDKDTMVVCYYRCQGYSTLSCVPLSLAGQGTGEPGEL